MSFICVICRDLLKITEESSPRNQSFLANTAIANHQSNNAAGRKKIVATKCGHLFHYDPCLSAWLSQSMNLTTDSKMRCPSCKQLIYIYELVQLFPVENNGSGGSTNGLEHTVQQKMKSMIDHLESLVKDLGKNHNCGSPPTPKKGNETPLRLKRIRDSPKKVSASQLAEIVKEFDSLRVSMKELGSFMEENAELGSVVESQAREISLLRSKNEMLEMENEKEKLKLKSDVKHTNRSLRTGETQTEEVTLLQSDSKEAQELANPHQTEFIVKPRDDSYNSDAIKKGRRKSVTFLDPFDEFNEVRTGTNTVTGSIPFDKKDLRVGDKVVWCFEGNPEIGTVKWKGFIGSQINVGVEFERQLGLPIKDFSADPIQCIFKSKPGHGRIIPVNELISYDKRFLSDTNLANYKSSDCVQRGSDKLNKRVQVCAHQ